MFRTVQLSTVAATLFVFSCASPKPAPKPAAPAQPPPAKPEMKKEEGPVWRSVQAIEAACDAGLGEVEAKRTMIKASKERTLAGTLDPYNQMLEAIDRTASIAQLLGAVHPNKPEREAAEACERKVRKLLSDINLDRGLFDAVSAVDTKSLDGQTQRFVAKVLRDFRRSGVDKDEATRAKLKMLNEQMVKVGQEFSRNIREDVRTVYVDSEKDLAGLPADWIKAHAPGKDGKIAVTTKYPDYFPVLEYAENEKLRKDLLVQFLNRGHPKNDTSLKKLLELRKDYAATLGYPNWAAYNAEDKMAKTAGTIATFIEDVAKIARPRMKRDLKQLLKRKKKDNRKAKAIRTWDRFYYVNKVRAEEYGFDSQSVRPYFEYSRVTKGLMDLYGELFGIRFVKNDKTPVWHESVGAYDVYSGDEKIASFYLDMHPRDGKYGHAAMFPIRTGLVGGAIPVGALVCNFPDPSKSEGPALMVHTQVVTYFHEFGHLVHQLLARGSKWVNLSGINVEWDFVEAPSQLLEEWAWDPAVLARFAKHVETNEPIPAEVVKKMRASAEFGKGVHIMRQVFYTALSFNLHVDDPAKIDLLAHLKDIQKRYMPYPYVDGTHTYAGFGHLEGYSSMYYTYQWSLVLAKDIFTRFNKEGLLNEKVARDYREKILAPGGTADANALVEGFLGRKSNLDAYKTWLESE